MDNKVDKQVCHLAAKTDSCTISPPSFHGGVENNLASLVLKNISKSDKTLSSPYSKAVSSYNHLTHTRRKGNKVTKPYLKAPTFKYKYRAFQSHIDDGLASKLGSLTLNQSRKDDLGSSSAALVQTIPKKIVGKQLPTINDHTCSTKSKVVNLSSALNEHCSLCQNEHKPSSPGAIVGSTNKQGQSKGVVSIDHINDNSNYMPKVFLHSKSCHGKNAKLKMKQTCSAQARSEWDFAADDLASYMSDCWVLPKEMSSMAEMMYT
jgi:hypothetical protein